MSENNALTEVKKGELTVDLSKYTGAVGKHLSSADISVSGLLLMQGISKAVTKKKAMIGDLVDSQSLEKYGDDETPVEFLIFATEKRYEITEYIGEGKQEEFLGFESVEEAGKNPDFKFQKDGKELRRRLSYLYFGLISQNGKTRAFPLRITMRKTAIDTAKSLNKYIMEQELSGMPAFTKVIAMNGVETNRDDNTFYVWQWKESRNANNDEILAAIEWYELFDKQRERFQADESEVTGEAGAKEASAENVNEDEEDFIS